jgi:hypothetical protein
MPAKIIRTRWASHQLVGVISARTHSTYTSRGEHFIAIWCRLRIATGIGPWTDSFHTLYCRVAAADKMLLAHATRLR